MYKNTLPFSNKEGIKMIAHRGASGLETENTCASFVVAGSKTYYGIETDVHLTADGQFILIHDDDLKRVANLNLPVEESTFERLRQIRLPDVDGNIREDLCLPSLDEYIRICKRYQKQAVLELKNRIPDEKIIQLIQRIIALDYFPKTTFISFFGDNLLTVRQAYPSADVQYLTETCDEWEIKFMLDNRLDADLYDVCVTKEKVNRLKSAGLKVNCWTVNTVKIAEKMKACGVDFITTDILE